MHIINKKERTEIADDFRRRRLHNIVQLNGYDELVERAKTYNAVMVGSDQLWPPDVSFSNYLSLMFVPEGSEEFRMLQVLVWKNTHGLFIARQENS